MIGILGALVETKNGLRRLMVRCGHAALQDANTLRRSRNCRVWKVAFIALAVVHKYKQYGGHCTGSLERRLREITE